MDSLIGQTIAQYRIDEQIGHGGMAVVYKAYDTARNLTVALKILPFDITRDKQQLEDFRNESFLSSQLRHPNILHALDSGETPECAYIVMRLIDNGTLADRLHGSPWPLYSAAKVVEHIGAALTFAHAAGLVHLDVKPSNILIDAAGNYLLADFGISRALMAERARKSTEVVGTPSYMSPEQCRGEPGDQRSDIYSLGVVLYELITGRLPFTGATKEEVMQMQVQASPVAPRALNPLVPVAMHKVIERVLDKNPEDRFASVPEMISAVRLAMAQVLQVEQAQDAAAPTARTSAVLPKPTEIATVVVPQLKPQEQAVYVYDETLNVITQVFARGTPKTNEIVQQEVQVRKEAATKDCEATQQRSAHFQDMERERRITLFEQKQKQQRQERWMGIVAALAALVAGVFAAVELSKFITELLSK